MNDHDESIRFYNSLRRPLLILSSRAGRGNISIADALHELFEPGTDVYHRSIEDFLPPHIVHEDLVRYKFISNHLPWLLCAMYAVPLFYQRKRLREKIRRTRLPAFKAFLAAHRITTVVCVSHRQAFWTTVLKRNESLDLAVIGVLTEFGNNLGWKYVFWNEMNGFVSPLPASQLRMGIPDALPIEHLPLPARSAYRSLANVEPPNHQFLLMGGFFGQGAILKTLDLLVRHFSNIHVHVVCGENARLEATVRRRYGHLDRIAVYGVTDAIEGILRRCACVITKPGMATLLEAHASRRKIFLFSGLPIAESHNARYAIRHFDAEWFSIDAFSRWLDGARHRESSTQ